MQPVWRELRAMEVPWSNRDNGSRRRGIVGLESRGDGDR
jgi:hypothetical protein